MWGDGRDGTYGIDNPSSETYLTLNGLSVADDAVLGDYEIWGTAREGTKWTITARSGGDLLWIAGGTFSEFQEETERLTATVTSYADSDCTIDDYGESGLSRLPNCNREILAVGWTSGAKFFQAHKRRRWWFGTCCPPG